MPHIGVESDEVKPMPRRKGEKRTANVRKPRKGRPTGVVTFEPDKLPRDPQEMAAHEECRRHVAAVHRRQTESLLPHGWRERRLSAAA